MPIQIGGKPDSGFDDPIGMLTDCHRRIERFLGILCHVAERAAGRALTPEEDEAVEAALRYFHESGPHHNHDEEDSLFPRLRTAKADVLSQVDRLEGEHTQAEALHKESAELFARWAAEGGLPAFDRNRLRAVMAKLQQICAEHIVIEENIVFPTARKLLDRGAIAAVGAEFKARRA